MSALMAIPCSDLSTFKSTLQVSFLCKMKGVLLSWLQVLISTSSELLRVNNYVLHLFRLLLLFIILSNGLTIPPSHMTTPSYTRLHIPTHPHPFQKIPSTFNTTPSLSHYPTYPQITTHPPMTTPFPKDTLHL